MENESNPADASNLANQARQCARIAAGHLQRAKEIKSSGASWREQYSPENQDLLKELASAERNFIKAMCIYTKAFMSFGISKHFDKRVRRQINGIAHFSIVHIRRQTALASGVPKRKAMQMR